jgi:hypothetical protein
MMQVGPHDAATNFCNWMPFWRTCRQFLPDWFDSWGWILPAFLFCIALIVLFFPLAELHRQRVRFMNNMRRFIYASDKDLTDAEQSVQVINRWRADRGLAVLDPNE